MYSELALFRKRSLGVRHGRRVGDDRRRVVRGARLLRHRVGAPGVKRVAALVALALAAASCGSTVQLHGAAGVNGNASLNGPADFSPSTSVGRDAGSAAATAAGAGATGSGSLESHSAVASSGPGASTPRGALPSSSGHRPPNVPGVTATTVKVGLEYIDAAALGTFANSAGAKGVGGENALDVGRVLADYLNRHGGVAGGRKLVLVPYDRSPSDSNQTAAQAECAKWTEDDRVFVANASLYQDSPLVPCLASHGVISVAAGQPEAGSYRDFARFNGLYYGPATMDTVSAAKAYIHELLRVGFLGKTHKIGLIWFGFNDLQLARTEGIIPALRAAGMSITSDFRADYSGNPADLGALAADMQNAELQFRAAGVDRVISLDYQGTLEFFFQQQAQNQGYHPLYGINSLSDTAFLQNNSPAAQLVGSVGIGWLPGEDVLDAHQPDTPAELHCEKILKDAGQTISAQTDRLVFYETCTYFFFLDQVLNHVDTLTPAALRLAAGTLQDWPTAAGFADQYAADKLWGANTGRSLAYQTSCSCFAYTGPGRPLR